MRLLSPVRSAHLLSVKSNTVINVLTRRMTALVTVSLCQMVLVVLSFLLMFLLDVTAANVNKTKAWSKAGSPLGMVDVIETSEFPLCKYVHYTLMITFSFQMYIGISDIFSPYKKMRTFMSICVQCPLNLQTIVMTR